MWFKSSLYGEDEKAEGEKSECIILVATRNNDNKVI